MKMRKFGRTIYNKQLIETNAAVQRHNRPIYKCLCSLHLYKTFRYLNIQDVQLKNCKPGTDA